MRRSRLAAIHVHLGIIALALGCVIFTPATSFGAGRAKGIASIAHGVQLAFAKSRLTAAEAKLSGMNAELARVEQKADDIAQEYEQAQARLNQADRERSKIATELGPNSRDPRMLEADRAAAEAHKGFKRLQTKRFITYNPDHMGSVVVYTRRLADKAQRRKSAAAKLVLDLTSTP